MPACDGLLPDFPLVASLADASARSFAYVLDRRDGVLALVSLATGTQPLSIDFEKGRLGFRLAQGRARQETLVKAVLGRHAPDNTRVLDATAGLGRDSALLAASGCGVVSLERDPLLHALLQDAIARAAHLPFTRHMQLQQADAIGFLQASDQTFDVIYLDPMFADQTGKAQVKKELMWMRQLLAVPAPEEEQMLLHLARQKAGRRVVVKRAAKAQPLANVAPTASIKGKAVRFDIYTPAV